MWHCPEAPYEKYAVGDHVGAVAATATTIIVMANRYTIPCPRRLAHDAYTSNQPLPYYHTKKRPFRYYCFVNRRFRHIPIMVYTNA